MKPLDRTRDFSVVSGVAEHRYEQDDMRFDVEGKCMDLAPGKPDPKYRRAGDDVPGRNTATTSAGDPSVIEQIEKQTGITVGNNDLPPDQGSGTPPGATVDTSTELETLGLKAKVLSALRGAEVDSVEALCRCTAKQLEALPNLGAAAVKDIKAALKRANKKLA